MSVRKSKPYKLARMFESEHLKNIARARSLVRDARELINQSKELVEETKVALASSKQRESRRAATNQPTNQPTNHRRLTRALVDAGDLGASMTYA